MDSELPNKMADLDIMEIDNPVREPPDSDENVPATTSRVLRKRKHLAVETNKPNRRVNMQPRKRNMKEDSNPKQIEALYLNKKVKTVSQSLETIYEEPKNGQESNIKGRKVKRLLTFQLGNHYTKEKIKKRRAKIKKLLSKSFLNRKKVPMPVFLKTIECLDLDEVVHTHVETKTIESTI